MSLDWTPHETGTHQDHVIAHVTGTTVLGFYRTDQAIHILLDIGFIWTIYVDGEMGLLPQPVAISELEVNAATLARLRADVQLLQTDGRHAEGLTEFTAAPVDCLISEVSFSARGCERQILITGEESSLAIETSLVTGALHVQVASSASDAA
jgi:hypothetical protein